MKKRKLSLHAWLNIIGGFIIFLSWIAEKKFQEDFSAEKEKLKRSQLVIDITEAHRGNFEIAYLSEIQKSEPDSLLVSFLQKRLSRIYLDLLTWSKGRVMNDAEGYSKIIKLKEDIISQTDKAFDRHEFGIINNNYNFVSDFFGKNYKKLDEEFGVKYDSVEQNEDNWNKIFTFLYILGSTLIGIGYVYEQLKEK